MKNSLFLALLPIIGLGVYAAKVNPMSEADLVQANLPKVEKSKTKHQILCFSKPFGFRHNSIEIGETMLRVMGQRRDFLK